MKTLYYKFVVSILFLVLSGCSGGDKKSHDELNKNVQKIQACKGDAKGTDYGGTFLLLVNDHTQKDCSTPPLKGQSTPWTCAQEDGDYKCGLETANGTNYSFQGCIYQDGRFQLATSADEAEGPISMTVGGKYASKNDGEARIEGVRKPRESVKAKECHETLTVTLKRISDEDSDSDNDPSLVVDTGDDEGASSVGALTQDDDDRTICSGNAECMAVQINAPGTKMDFGSSTVHYQALEDGFTVVAGAASEKYTFSQKNDEAFLTIERPDSVQQTLPCKADDFVDVDQNLAELKVSCYVEGVSAEGSVYIHQSKI